MAKYRRARSARKDAGERIRKALENKRRRRRRWWGGRAPYGWRLAADGQSAEKVEAEQMVINQMRRWRKAGKSYHQIALLLYEGSIPTKTGKPLWHAAQVKKILDAAARTR